MRKEKGQKKNPPVWFHYFGKGGWGENNSNSKRPILFDVTFLNQEQNLAINIQLTESHVLKVPKKKKQNLQYH